MNRTALNSKLKKTIFNGVESLGIPKDFLKEDSQKKRIHNRKRYVAADIGDNTLAILNIVRNNTCGPPVCVPAHTYLRSEEKGKKNEEPAQQRALHTRTEILFFFFTPSYLLCFSKSTIRSTVF